MARAGITLALVAVALLAGTATAIETSEDCICQPPTPCHFEGHCSAIVGGQCSPGTELCDPVPGDTDPPQFQEGYPKLSDLRDTSFVMEVKLNEAGRFNWVLLEDDATPPNTFEVIEGTGADGEAVLDSGEVTVLIAGTLYSDFVGDLVADTEYDLYITAADSAGNTVQSPTKINVRTDIDQYPPEFGTGYPTVVNPDHISFDLAVMLREAGTVHYVVGPSNSAPPTAAAIAADDGYAGSFTRITAGSIDVPNVNSVFEHGITSLDFEPEGTYSVFAVTEDALGNVMPHPARVEAVLTEDSAVPSFVDGFPTIHDTTDSSTIVDMKFDESANYFVVVLADGAFAPPNNQLRSAANAGTSATVFAVATGSAATIGEVASASLTGLKHATSYEIYLAAEDVWGNLSPVAHIHLTTLADHTAPGTTNGPTVSALRDTSFSVTGGLSEPGTLFAIAVPAGSPAVDSNSIVTTPGASSGTVPSANANAILGISGLAPETAYTVYMVGRDVTGNLQGTPTTVDVTTLKAVAKFEGGYPTIANTEEVSVTVASSLDAEGTVYGIIVARNHPEPSRETVAAGVGGGIISSSSIAAPTPGSPVNLVLGNLQPATLYDCYIVSVNVDGVVSDAVKLPFLSGGDVTPPSFLGGYPRVTGVTDQAAKFQVKLDEPGTVYFVALSDGTAGPTVDAVIARTAGGSVATGFVDVEEAGTLYEVSMSGFAHSTQYDLYALAVDLKDNHVFTPTLIEFQTSVDVTPAVHYRNYPRVVSVTQSGATVEVRLSEPGKFYYIVLPHTTHVPSSLAVKSGTGRDVVTTGQGSIADPAVVGAGTFGGLSADTEYDVYVAAEDNAGNLQTVAVGTLFETQPDTTAPSFSEGHPMIASVTDRRVNVQVQTNERAENFAVAVPRDAPAPTADEVIAGTAAAGAAATSANSATFGAGAIGAVTLMYLSPESDYDIYVVARDEAGNAQSSVSHLAASTVADDFAPLFAAGYPDIHEVTENDITVAVRANEPATVYWVVVPNGAPAPSASDVRAGAATGGTAALTSGQATLTDPRETLLFDIMTGPLDPETAYDLYVIMEDDFAHMTSPATKVDVSTVVDNDAPVNAAGYPTIQSTIDRSTTVATKTDEHGKFWIVAVARGAAAPTSEQVRAGKSANNVVVPSAVGTMLANQEATKTLYNLEPETSYDVYVAAEDYAGNLAAAATKLEVDTDTDTHAPGFVAPTPEDGGSTESFVNIRVIVTEPVVINYVVLADGSGAPSVDEVNAGTGAGGSDVAEAGAQAVATAGTELYVRVPTDKLAEDADYDVHIVAVDLAGHSSDAFAIDVHTVIDDTAPSFRTGYPSVSGLQSYSAVFDVMASERSSVAFVVVPAGATAPSASEVRAGTASGGQSPLVTGSATLPEADFVLGIPVTGLQETTSYDAFLVAWDSKDNVQAAPTKLRFTTLTDTFPPELSMGIENLLDSSWTFAGTVNEPCTIYFMIHPSGTAAPTPTQLLNLQGTSGTTGPVDTGDGPVPVDSGVFEVHDITPDAFAVDVLAFTDPGTDYDIWFIAQDHAAAPNVNGVDSIALTTGVDVTAPRDMAGFPRITNEAADSATLEVQLSEAATVFYVVIASPGVTEPIPEHTAAGVIAGEAPNDSTTAVIAHSRPVVGSRITSFISLVDLNSLQDYIVYVVAQDGAGNAQADANVLQFTTRGIATAAQQVLDPFVFGQGDTGKFDFSFLIIGGIILLALVLCCCWLGRRKNKYTHLDEPGSKVDPSTGGGDAWDGDGDFDDLDHIDNDDQWSPVERAGGKWARRSSGETGSTSRGGPLLDEMDGGAAAVVTKSGAGAGIGEVNRTPISADRRAFVNREMMDLDAVLQEAEDVSSHVMNRAPELVEESEAEFDETTIVAGDLAVTDISLEGTDELNVS